MTIRLSALVPTLVPVLVLACVACGPGPDPRPLIDRAVASIDPEGMLAGTL